MLIFFNQAKYICKTVLKSDFLNKYYALWAEITPIELFGGSFDIQTLVCGK